MVSSKREGSAPLPTVKSKPTRKKFSSVGCRTGNWILPPSIPTLPSWMEDRSGDTLISSVEDSPARISALPENSQESTESVPVYGENTPGSFARFDPDGSSWRTSQTSLFSECIEYSETWPQAGTMLNGVVFQRQRWVRRTSATESGSSGNWPTPTNSMMTWGDFIQAQFCGNDPKRPSYQEAKNNWPTPTSRDHKDTGDSIMNGTVPVNGLLGRAVAPTKVKGSLDPAFVEYLMGYPLGWTSLKD